MRASRLIAHRDILVVQVTARQDATLEAGLVGLPPPRLVLAHQARVAHHVGGEDRGEAARAIIVRGTPALRMPS